MSEREICDVLVVGGGLTGLPLALALRGANGDSGLSVKVLSKEGPDDRLAPGQDGRAFALSASSRNLLQVLGVWPHLEGRAQPMNSIEITDTRLEEAVRPVLLQMDNRRENGDPAAYVVEAHVLRRALADCLRERDDIEIVHPAEVTGFQADGAGVSVDLADGGKTSARLLAASDGRASGLRRMAGIRTVDWPADQWGIVAAIEVEHPHNGRAVQHFLPSGPFAILPLTGNRVSLVWTERRELAAKVARMGDDEFMYHVRQRMGEDFGELGYGGNRNAFPLSMLVARDYVKERFALVGDAAHGMHWIAGQGLNYGLRDVAALAETLIEANRLGLDIGSVAQLERYESWRRFDSFAFTAGMVALNSLFSNDNFLLRGVRDFGLNLAGHLPFAKNFFVEEAAGLSGEVPRLLKGEAV